MPTPNATPSPEVIAGATEIVLVIAEAIRDLGTVPSGHLYARLMEFLTIDQYSAVIAKLVKTGLVIESGHELTWVGPRKN